MPFHVKAEELFAFVANLDIAEFLHFSIIGANFTDLEKNQRNNSCPHLVLDNSKVSLNLIKIWLDTFCCLFILFFSNIKEHFSYIFFCWYLDLNPDKGLWLGS